MTEELEIPIEFEEVFLERVPADDYISMKRDRYFLHLVGSSSSSTIEISKAEFEYLKGERVNG